MINNKYVSIHLNFQLTLNLQKIMDNLQMFNFQILMKMIIKYLQVDFQKTDIKYLLWLI